MFSIRRPTEATIRSYLEARSNDAFTYATVGCTREQPRSRHGWNIDHERVLLGYGEEVFRQARAAIESWRMFPREVAEVYWPDVPIAAGSAVGVLYWAAPARMWLLCPARIIFVIDGPRNGGPRNDGTGSETVEQFGFAYGTLPGHPERGEERFLIEWNRADDSVWYDLTAVSQPAHWLARLGYPYARYEQARFRKLSAAAMQAAARQGATHEIRAT